MKWSASCMILRMMSFRILKIMMEIKKRRPGEAIIIKTNIEKKKTKIVRKK